MNCDDCEVEVCELGVETNRTQTRCVKCKKMIPYYDKALMVYVRTYLEHEIFFCQNCSTEILGKLILRS